jgi:hypothetical protein
MRWLCDRAVRRHLLGLALLLGGFGAAAAAQSAVPPMSAIAPPSLFEKWLSPDVVIGGVLVLLYAGELRGDMRRMKAQMTALQEFRDGLHEELDRKYMSREALEARLAALSDRPRHGPQH